MRSLSLSCPGCCATYEACFAGEEPPAFSCRFCRAQLDEVAWETSTATEGADHADLPQLRVTQHPFGELRVWLDHDLGDDELHGRGTA